jgi:di-heme oxidoreductase (putative peroxidase)
MITANSRRRSVSLPRENTRPAFQVDSGDDLGAAEDRVRSARTTPALRMASGALIAIAILGLANCGTHRTARTTAPMVRTTYATTDDAVDDTTDVSGDVLVDLRELGATPLTTSARGTTLGGPLDGLDAGLLARFNAGRDEFMDEDDEEEGLGPVFNEASCASCHDAPVGGTTGRVETRFGRTANGQFDPMEQQGGSLLQDHALGEVAGAAGTYDYVPEVVPAQANVRAGRVTTPLFGLGLVDAVPDATFLTLARLEARYSPSTRGTPHLVTEVSTGATRVGRFGWKAQVPTLHQFSGDAYLNEMGVTNPDFPNENCPQGDCSKLAFNPYPALNNDGEAVEQFFDFMTLLGPPPRADRSRPGLTGEKVFARIGCADCHTPALVTGPSPVPALSAKVFFPYSDFLLHDMGALGDGIVQGQAGPRQMRTAPLWGLGSRSVYLHDARARSVQDAILAHSGQGASARARYYRLNFNQRAALLAFLRSL